MMDFIEELKWRGLYYDMIPGTDEYLRKNKAIGYIGFDPSAPSLGIGNLVQIMVLKFFEKAGHQAIVLIGGATGMIGDPSGKTTERTLLDEEELLHNTEQFKQQLSRFFDFGDKPGQTRLLNNYDWFKQMGLLEFLRDVGKHLTVNYMLAKESVKSRMESGISFTEFSYQLLQAFDFYHLYKNYNCTVQMGGSDQWGNLTAGVELIRRKLGKEAYAVTSPLITKADGTKFGKTEEGNIFLDPKLTSPYKFYQFWINCSDEDAEKMIKIFTFLNKKEIFDLIHEHNKAPNERILQQKLAEEVTVMVHSREAYEKAVKASRILFGKATRDLLESFSDNDLLQIFEGVPQFKVNRQVLEENPPLIEFLTTHTGIFPSKAEVRRNLKGNAISLNKEKVNDENRPITPGDLINNRFILFQKGRKNFYLVIVE